MFEMIGVTDGDWIVFCGLEDPAFMPVGSERLLVLDVAVSTEPPEVARSRVPTGNILANTDGDMTVLGNFSADLSCCGGGD